VPPIEGIVRGLVREYLFRNGHTDVLRLFDQTTPPGPDWQQMTTSELVKSLHLIKLYKRNSERGGCWVPRSC
jgi:hypothetical protein